MKTQIKVASEIVYLLLLGHSCGDCQNPQTARECAQWMGESIGWQWMPKYPDKICMDWKKD